jgi:PKD repeat protein
MKMLVKKNMIGLLSLAVLFSGAFISCSEDDGGAAPDPVAQFEYSIDTANIEVTFTNNSENATEYQWEFGDGNTSTEEAPTHTYAEYGSYDVTLTVTNEDGATDNETSTISVTEPMPEMDGDFSDWSEIESFYSYPDAPGTLKEAKITSDGNFIYFYLKGTSDMGPIFQVYLNSDADTTTGWNHWDYYENPGLDLLIEWPSMDESASLIRANMENPDWPWTDIVAESGVIQENSEIVVSGDVAEIEFMVPQAILPDLAEQAGIEIVNSDTPDWNAVGHLPLIQQDPLLELKMYEF